MFKILLVGLLMVGTATRVEAQTCSSLSVTWWCGIIDQASGACTSGDPVPSSVSCQLLFKS